jgi:hypothetical protein
MGRIAPRRTHIYSLYLSGQEVGLYTDRRPRMQFIDALCIIRGGFPASRIRLGGGHFLDAMLIGTNKSEFQA